MDESDIVATQLVLGKQVLEIIIDLLTNEKRLGTVLSLSVNEQDFKITVEKEV
jgi:hypothetical protein|nr:MAG TPA: Protein of unknown function (DUF2766) [Caudoviricetes sp.]